MPSIFIWKSNETSTFSTNTSKKKVQYYAGSNWFLEDNDFSSKSYMLIDQTTINSNNDTIIVFNAKKMPQDWVGSELLEISNIPYEQIKSDNYGTLERVGDWMRFISKTDTEFDSESLHNELINIKKWMVQKEKEKDETHHISKPIQHFKENFPLSSENIQQNFQEFFNRYSTPLPIADTSITNSTRVQNNRNRHYNKNNTYMGKNNNKYVKSNDK